MRKLSYIFGIIILMLSLTSCDYTNPQFKAISHFKLAEFSHGEVSFTADVTFYNPNNYNLKIRPSNFDLYLNDACIGKVKLLKKYKMKKHGTTTASVPGKLILNNGGYLKILQAILHKKAKVGIKGKLKTGVFIFGFREDIDKSITMDAQTIKNWLKL